MTNRISRTKPESPSAIVVWHGLPASRVRGLGFRNIIRAACLLAAVLPASGCVQPLPDPPVTVIEIDNAHHGQPGQYPPRTVFLYNLQRALDPALAGEQRIESLRVARRLCDNDSMFFQQAATLLGHPNAPAELQNEAAAMLLSEDVPGLAGQVVQALAQMRSAGPHRRAVLEWLARRGRASALPEVARLWAGEPAGGADEELFRRVVQGITGKRWDQGLIEAINSPAFTARGSALEVLVARLSAAALRSAIAEQRPRTEAMSAMQAFSSSLGYLPANGRELLLSAWAHQTKGHLVGKVGGLARKWRTDYGYEFNIRDFHLLSRLAEDSIRLPLKRSELLARLTEAIESRRHIAHRPSAPGADDDYVDLLAAHLERLTVADLWNLQLLDEMLSQPLTRQALRVAAQRDQADVTSAWGGLVFYESGRAAARLYPARANGGSDLAYLPTERMETDARDCLCRFQMHFEKVHNAARAGPTGPELLAAREGNYYGLVLTRVGQDHFCAHYYNPNRIVVSLGTFSFK